MKFSIENCDITRLTNHKDRYFYNYVLLEGHDPQAFLSNKESFGVKGRENNIISIGKITKNEH